MFLFVKPCQLRVNGCFSHYGLIYTPGFSSFSCRPSNFFPGRPSEFFHLPRSSVRPNFPQVFNLIFSDAGYRPAATFLSVSLHPGFEEWVCFWLSLSWYDKTFINLVATTKPKTSQSHNIDLHQSTESTGTKIYFSRRFSMLSMLSK